MSPEVRSLIAADAVLAHPEAGPAHVALAISAALTDYRRAFARRLVAAGVKEMTVWQVMGSLPLNARVPIELTGPLSPEVVG